MASKTEFVDRSGPKSNPSLPRDEWGWAVICATFFIRLTIPSLRVSFNVVYLSLTQDQGMSNLATSFIMALFVAIFSITSPFSTSLSLYYSHRRLVFAGIILISTGLALCSLSLSLPLLLVCYGILGGVGCSLASTNSFLITQKYHNKRRTTANFLSSFGSCLSFLVMPIFIYLLILQLTIRGAFLIWSALILNCLVGAMFYRPSSKTSKASNQSEVLQPIPEFDEGLEQSNECSEESQDENFNIVQDQEIPLRNIEHKSEENLEEMESYVSDNHSLKSLSQNSEFEDCRTEPYFEDPRRISFFSTAASVDSFKTTKSIYMSMENTFASIEYMDVLGNSSLSRMKENETNCPVIVINDDIEPVVQGMTSNHGSKLNGVNLNPHMMKRMEENTPFILCGLKLPRIKDIISFEPITSLPFLAYCFSSIFNKQVHLSYILYLPLIASRIDCQNEIPVLLGIVATGEFIATFCASLISQKKWIPIRYLYIMVSFVNSLCCLVLLFSDEFIPLAVTSASLGVGMGVTVSIDPLLLVEHVSADHLTHSYGLVLLLTGIVSMIMYPIQGWTLDVTGSFHVLGIILSVSALIPAMLWILVSIFYEKAQVFDNNYSSCI